MPTTGAGRPAEGLRERKKRAMRRQLSERPRSLVSLCSGVPQKLDAALLRALEKSPDRRYPSAGAFIAALASGAHRVRVIGRRVAVIPFVHASARPAVDPYSDGVGEEVAVALSEFEEYARALR